MSSEIHSMPGNQVHELYTHEAANLSSKIQSLGHKLVLELETQQHQI